MDSVFTTQIKQAKRGSIFVDQSDDDFFSSGKGSNELNTAALEHF